MDNITHALAGAALTGIALTSPHIATDPVATGAVVWATAIGSQAPDFDFVFRLWRGQLVYLQQHRGFSHSIPMWFVWPTLITVVLTPFFDMGYFTMIWLWAFLSVLAHVGLDLLTAYGTQAFWPFSNRRYGYDILAIVEPILILCGLSGFYCWHRGLGHGTVVALFGGIALGYIAMRAVISMRLRQAVLARYRHVTVDHLSVVPSFGLRKWHFIVDSDSCVYLGRVFAPDAQVIEDRKYVGKPLPISEKVLKRSKVYRVFRWFARHPFVECSEDNGYLRIDMVDLLFRYNEQTPFRAYIVFDGEGNVLEEHVGRKFEFNLVN